MWTVAKLANEGTRAEGTVLEIGPAKDQNKTYYVADSEVQYRLRLRIAVQFPDGKSSEFEADVPDHFDWNPNPRVNAHGASYDPFTNTSTMSRRPRPAEPQYGPDPQPIPLTFEVGTVVPVRHDPHRRKFIVDLVALRLQVVPVWLATFS